MKRSTDRTNPPASKRKRPLRELWKRLLTEDDLDTVQGGGSQSRSSPGTCRSSTVAGVGDPMKRSADRANPPASKRKRPLRELWKRLLTEDDLDDVRGGGEPKPISTGHASIDSGCGGG